MAVPPPTLQEALAWLQRGQLDQAERTLLALQQAEPGNFAAIHLLGVVFLQRGENLGALQQFDQAAQVNPKLASLHYNRGNALSALQRLDEAVASYDAALALTPDLAEAHFNRGNALRGLGRSAEALAGYRQAVALTPGLFQAHNNIGNVLYELQRLPEALASFKQVLAINPSHVEAMNNQGMVLHDLQRPAEALTSFDRAIALDPRLVDAFHNRARVLQALGRLDEAIESYDRVIAINPEDADAFNHRGIALHESRRIAQALENYERAIALRPDFAEAWNNRGNGLHDLRQLEGALHSYQMAIDLKPEFAEAINNRGMVQQDLRRLDAARTDYDTAIALRPGYAEALKRRAGLKLLQGEFAGGWADFETGLEHTRASTPAVGGPPYWRGESLAGKSILLSEPNGLGDTLQFFRFVPLLLQQGARVSFLGPARFFRVLVAFSDRVRFISKPGQERFDFQCWLWSLPHYLRVDANELAIGVPYLRAEAALVDKWSRSLDRDRFNIGICWQGNPERKIDAGRSIPLANFFPLSQVPGVRLISLQKNFGIEQLEQLPAGMNVESPGTGFDDGPDAFVDSAAMLASLDLMIASDTAIIHLAGALGRPAWMALNFVPEWRWMLDRQDSPWYPSLRLFRQLRSNEWSPVFEAMSEALTGILAESGQEQGELPQSGQS